MTLISIKYVFDLKCMKLIKFNDDITYLQASHPQLTLLSHFNYSTDSISSVLTKILKLFSAIPYFDQVFIYRE